MVKMYRLTLGATCGLLTVISNAAFAAPPDLKIGPPSAAQIKAVESLNSRGVESDSKLEGELSVLSRHYSEVRSRGSSSPVKPSTLQLFGIRDKDANPTIEIAITGKTDESELTKLGAKVRFQADGVTYASIPVKSLEPLGKLDGIEFVQGMHAMSIPKPPQHNTTAGAPPRSTSRNTNDQLADSFDRQQLSGKGVVVGVVDSGIDWKHPDFINPDGTSRILYIWDMNDKSYETSGGKIGNKAPESNVDGTSIGTLYTREQITAALGGKGIVNSFDQIGHGTACAGVAAGNGEGTANGVPKGTYMGVAPKADLIICCAPYRDERGIDAGGIRADAYLGVKWIVSQAKELKRPCSINLSYGGHDTGHDGNATEERVINSLAGPGKPGVAICVAGGNERGNSLHASGRFGPAKEGSQRESRWIELNTYDSNDGNASVAFCFDTKDDWGIDIYSYDGGFLRTSQGEGIILSVWNSGRALPNVLARVGESEYRGEIAPGTNFSIQNYRDQFLRYNADGRLLVTTLPAGKYLVRAWGHSDMVGNGRFDAYVFGPGSFGNGSEHQFMIGSPGNAKNAITIGAYDFRTTWTNADGKTSYRNLMPGELSDYSNPGYSRDGTVKPDIVAPATYAISSLGRQKDSTYVQMGSDPESVTADGYHLAWSGTSAATPFVTGLVALMMEKNPNLDADQIRKLLAENATRDSHTGGTPNRDWGYGKLNPVATLKATDSGKAM
ncbi:S8 family serine peptidase [Candidatus Obscuribacterales bacterium]|nr:S8 family serine peptidase [Candidatus Obscuribacterales bacterium]